MLKHVTCGGDLNVFGGDADLLFACGKCGKTWQLAASALGTREATIGRDGLSLAVDRERPRDDLAEIPDKLLRDARREYPQAFGGHHSD